MNKRIPREGADETCARGKKVRVNWITTEDNDINIECGEDFAEELHYLTFEMVIQPQ